MKRLVILGATGSIGSQAVEIVRMHRDRLELIGVSAYGNGAGLQAICDEFPSATPVLFDEAQAQLHGMRGGMEAMIDLVVDPNVDIVLVAVAGVIGLKPTIAAIQAGKDIALASKEVLVAAGDLVMKLVQAHGTTMTPVDSEHSAIFQCIQGSPKNHLDSVILTASGGPFRGKSRQDLESVGVEQALKHPNWTMGSKITIDSATLMNKALEVIEARWLFDLDLEKVQVVVHPQSIVHSIAVLSDGSALAQCGWPDMRLPIQYGLLYPDRPVSPARPWNPIESPELTFEPVDYETFPSITFGKQALKIGGTMPCVFNAANETAVAMFLNREIGFLEIFDVVAQTMADHRSLSPTLENLLEADSWARERTSAEMGRTRKAKS